MDQVNQVKWEDDGMRVERQGNERQKDRRRERAQCAHAGRARSGWCGDAGRPQLRPFARLFLRQGMLYRAPLLAARPLLGSERQRELGHRASARRQTIHRRERAQQRIHTLRAQLLMCIEFEREVRASLRTQLHRTQVIAASEGERVAGERRCGQWQRHLPSVRRRIGLGRDPARLDLGRMRAQLGAEVREAAQGSCPG